MDKPPRTPDAPIRIPASPTVEADRPLSPELRTDAQTLWALFVRIRSARRRRLLIETARRFVHLDLDGA